MNEKQKKAIEEIVKILTTIYPNASEIQHFNAITLIATIVLPMYRKDE